MTCEAFREALMGAEAARLDDARFDAAREHAAGCEACAADLSAVEAGIARITTAMAVAGPGFSADRAVELATSSNRRARGLGWLKRIPAGARAVGTLGVIRWRVATPALAGGVLAVWIGVSVLDDRDADTRSAVVHVAELRRSLDLANPAGIGVAEDSRPAFSINAPEDGQVAVFQTSNPKIRVVWFYGNEDSGD